MEIANFTWLMGMLQKRLDLPISMQNDIFADDIKAGMPNNMLIPPLKIPKMQLSGDLPVKIR